MGTARKDYMELVRWIDAHTGGVNLVAQARSRYDDSGRCLSMIGFNGKCLNRKREKMFDIVSELLTAADFSDRARLKHLLQEYRAALETTVVRNGHQLAMSLAARNFSATLALEESWHGIHQLKTIKKLTEAPR